MTGEELAKGFKAMSDFNQALANLNATLNLDGKAAVQSLRELAEELRIGYPWCSWR